MSGSRSCPAFNFPLGLAAGMIALSIFRQTPPQAERTCYANFRNTTLGDRRGGGGHGKRGHDCCGIVVGAKVRSLAVVQCPRHGPFGFDRVAGWSDSPPVMSEYGNSFALCNELARLEQRIVDVVAEHAEELANGFPASICSGVRNSVLVT